MHRKDWPELDSRRNFDLYHIFSKCLFIVTNWTLADYCSGYIPFLEPLIDEVFECFLEIQP